MQIQESPDIGDWRVELYPHYMVSSGAETTGTFAKNIHVKASEKATPKSWAPAPVVSTAIMADTSENGKLQRFLKGQLRYEELMPTINSYGNWAAVEKNIAICFTDTGSLAETIGYNWGNSDIDYKLKLLDLLVTFNHMCNDSYTSMIESYLKYLNANGSPNFIVPFACATAVWKGVGDDGVYAASLPDYYGAIAGIGANNFMEIPSPGVDNLGGSVAATNAWAPLYEALVAKHKSVLHSQTPFSHRGCWWHGDSNYDNSGSLDGKNLALTTVPTNVDGKAEGLIGYTYLALGPAGTAPDPSTPPPDMPGSEDVSLPFIIDCVPQVQTGIEDTLELPKDTANCYGAVHFALFDPDRVYTQLEQQFKNAENGKATLHLEFSRTGDKNNRSPLQNNSVATSGALAGLGGTASVSGNTVTIKVENITYEILEKLSTKPEAAVAYWDGTFNLDKNCTNTYWCKAGFEFKLRGTDGTYSHTQISKLTPKGVLISGDKAGDDIYWRMKEDSTIHYRSELTGMNNTTEIVGNFAEIKNGTPTGTGGGNEAFEAMSGIPTDQPLSVRFGVNEFMQNLEGEIKENGNTERVSTYIWDFPHSYATEEKCVITCSGHSSGVPSECPNKHTHSDSCYNGALTCTVTNCTHSTKSNCYALSCTATTDHNITSATDLNCSDDGKWSWSWSCSCGASGSDSGSAPYDSGNMNKACVGGSNGTTICSTGKGCSVSHKRNTATKGCDGKGKHHGRKYKIVVTNPISKFKYLDITDYELWRVSRINYALNNELFETRPSSKAINTYAYSYTQRGDFSSGNGNGRLIFKTSKVDVANTADTSNGNIYGNFEVTHDKDNSYMLDTASMQKMQDWVNSLLVGTTVQALVVSDYSSMHTTKDWQTTMYHTYESEAVDILGGLTSVYDGLTSSNLTEHSSNTRRITGSTITFNTQPNAGSDAQPGGDFWYSNPDCAAIWNPRDLIRDGYNGQYSYRDKCMLNAKEHTTQKSPLEEIHTFQKRWELTATPIEGITSNSDAPKHHLTGTQGSTATQFYDGLKIHQCTSGKVPNGGIRVYNGVWDTGNVALELQTYKTDGINVYTSLGSGPFTKGFNYDHMETELGYTVDRGKVNDIVIHNPVSVRSSSVQSFDNDYDARTEESKSTGSANFAIIDRTFTINFPTGSTAWSEGTVGIKDPLLDPKSTTYVTQQASEEKPELITNTLTNDKLCRGYNLDSTEQWTRDKYVILPFTVRTAEGLTFVAGTPISLYYLGSVGTSYNFKLPLANAEAKDAEVYYLAIATNADPNVMYYDESDGADNEKRANTTGAARHLVSKSIFRYAYYVISYKIQAICEFKIIPTEKIYENFTIYK